MDIVADIWAVSIVLTWIIDIITDIKVYNLIKERNTVRNDTLFGQLFLDTLIINITKSLLLGLNLFYSIRNLVKPEKLLKHHETWAIKEGVIIPKDIRVPDEVVQEMNGNELKSVIINSLSQKGNTPLINEIQREVVKEMNDNGLKRVIINSLSQKGNTQLINEIQRVSGYELEGLKHKNKYRKKVRRLYE